MCNTLLRALKPLDPQRIESPITGLGIPDINFIGGWIECKWMRNWPVRADTQPVKFTHTLNQEQKIWLYRRAKMGGLVLVAAQVVRQWFFFNGITAYHLWDNMTRPEMCHYADRYYKNGLDGEDLIKFLRRESDGRRNQKSDSFSSNIRT